MSEVVTYQREGAIGVITVNYPPVNALSQAVRSGLLAALDQGQKDADAKALLLVCEGKTISLLKGDRRLSPPLLFLQEDGMLQVNLEHETHNVDLTQCDDLRIHRVLWWVTLGLTFVITRRDGYDYEGGERNKALYSVLKVHCYFPFHVALSDR